MTHETETLNSSNNNTNSCTNNEKVDNIANIHSYCVNNNNNNLHCTNYSNNLYSLISNNIKKINFKSCFRLLDPVIPVVNKCTITNYINNNYNNLTNKYLVSRGVNLSSNCGSKFTQI